MMVVLESTLTCPAASGQRLRACLHLHIEPPVGQDNLDVFIRLDDNGRGAGARSQQYAAGYIEVLIEKAAVDGFYSLELGSIKYGERGWHLMLGGVFAEDGPTL